MSVLARIGAALLCLGCCFAALAAFVWTVAPFENTESTWRTHVFEFSQLGLAMTAAVASLFTVTAVARGDRPASLRRATVTIGFAASWALFLVVVGAGGFAA